MQFSSIQTSTSSPIFSPCYNYFLTTNNNNIYIKQACLDLKNHAQISLKQFKLTDKLETVNTKFSPNSKLLAVYSKKRLIIYDLHGNTKIKIQDPQSQIQCVIWTKDSEQVMIFYANVYYLIIYNLISGEQLYIKNPKFYGENSVTFSKGISHDGVFTAILEKHQTKDCIGIYFTKTWQLINHIVLDTFDAVKIQFSDNGYILVTQNKINFKVVIVDIYIGVVQSYGNKDYVLGVSSSKFSNTGNFLALGGHDDCFHLLNTTTWKLITEMQISNEVDLQKTMVIKQKQGKFMPVQGSGKFRILKTAQTPGNPLGISSLQFSPDDRYLAIKIETMNNCVFIYQIQKLTLVSVIVLTEKVQMRDFSWFMNSENYCTLCMGYGNSSLLLWVQNIEDCLYEIDIPKNNSENIKVGRIQLGTNGKMLFYSNSLKNYVYAVREDQQYDYQE